MPKSVVCTRGSIQMPERVDLWRVCATWKSVVGGCCRFWANIEVRDDGDFEGDEEEYHSFVERFKTLVGRVNHSDLHLTFSWSPHYHCEATSKVTDLHDILLSSERSPRCRSLILDLGEYGGSNNCGFDNVARHLPSMRSLGCLEIKNVGNGSGPWLHWLTRVLRHVPGNPLERLGVKKLCLESQIGHCDGLVYHSSLSSYKSQVLTDIEAHVAPLVAVSMIQCFPALTRACFAYTEPQREVLGAWVRDLPVVHKHLLQLTLKTTPSTLTAIVKRSFPHAFFSSILHQLDVPCLTSLSLGTNPRYAVLPMGLDHPLDESEYEEDLAWRRQWVECDEHAESDMLHRLDRDPIYAQDKEDEVEFQNSFIFPDANHQCPKNGVIPLGKPFFPELLDGFLSRSPLLESLELIAIPFHAPQLVRVLERTPNLVKLDLVEVTVPREEENLYPTPLANDVVLDWLKDTTHLPRLESLKLSLTRFPPTPGSFESMLEARYALLLGNGDEAVHVFKKVDVVCEEIDAQVGGSLAYDRLKALKDDGLCVVAHSSAIHELGRESKPLVRGPTKMRTTFCIRESIPDRSLDTVPFDEQLNPNPFFFSDPQTPARFV
ncbi:hypothetical protein AAF712_015245 [Marasmius tenuissimus]|uniref:F-box domain-containing protein n=1 Tax=Marasmius tenuissimus TaxID=585030 RepID=A0ABR2Z9Y9_9AGAR